MSPDPRGDWAGRPTFWAKGRRFTRLLRLDSIRLLPRVMLFLVLLVWQFVLAKKPPRVYLPQHTHYAKYYDTTLLDYYHYVYNDTFTQPEHYKTTILNEELDWANYHLDHHLLDDMVSKMDTQYKAMFSTPTADVEIGNHRYFSEREWSDYNRWYRKVAGVRGEDLIVDVADYYKSLTPKPSYFKFGVLAPSPDGRYIAFTYQVGHERYTIQIVDMADPKHPVFKPKTIPDCFVHLFWSQDSKYLVYEKLLELDVQPLQIAVYDVETEEAPQVIFSTEDDKTIELSLSLSSDGDFIFITSGSLHGSEVHFLSRNFDTSPNGTTVTALYEFKEDIEYYVDHFGDWFYMRSQEGSLDVPQPDFCVARFKCDAAGHRTEYATLFEDTGKFHVDHIEIAQGFLMLWVLDLRSLLQSLIYFDLTSPTIHNTTIDFEHIRYDKEIYALERVDEDPTVLGSVGHGATVRAHAFYYFTYSSLITPPMLLRYDFENGAVVVNSSQAPAGGFDRTLFTTKREYVPRWDPDKNMTITIPITMVYKTTELKGRKKKRVPVPLKFRPSLVYVYGAYGTTIYPSFRADLIPLLEENFLFVIAHVRGGGMRGYEWRDTGRRMMKKNTFYDLLQVVKYISGGLTTYSKRELLAVEGRSAGGLPACWLAVKYPFMLNMSICDVPFVSVLDSMLDPKIPYTIEEYAEWGDPTADNTTFYNMLEYDPYNIMPASVKTKVKYPNIFLTVGKEDARVGYWQGIKFIQKLRVTLGGRSSLFLLNGYNTDHFGHQGHFKYSMDRARVAAFAIKLITGWEWHDPLEWLWILISIIVLGIWMVMFMMIFILCELRNRKKKQAEDENPDGYDRLGDGDDEGNEDQGDAEEGDFAEKSFEEDRPRSSSSSDED